MVNILKYSTPTSQRIKINKVNKRHDRYSIHYRCLLIICGEKYDFHYTSVSITVGSKSCYWNCHHLHMQTMVDCDTGLQSKPQKSRIFLTSAV